MRASRRGVAALAAATIIGAGLATAPAAAGPRVDARTAREQATRILSERRFHRHHVPKPFRGPLERIRDALGPLLDPTRPRTVPIVLGVAVALLGIFIAAHVVRVRTNAALRLAREPAPPRADPGRLEREAEAAERRGDLERAIRLRFRAGLLRLDRAKAIAFSPATTTSEVSRTLRSGDFEAVASSFDEVVYGRRAPGGGDLELSREGWRRVLAAVGAR